MLQGGSGGQGQQAGGGAQGQQAGGGAMGRQSTARQHGGSLGRGRR
jgi:hypothetical protein